MRGAMRSARHMPGMCTQSMYAHADQDFPNSLSKRMAASAPPPHLLCEHIQCQLQHRVLRHRRAWRRDDRV